MEKKNLKILFVASECAPFAKVGGLADFIASLPKALRKIGLDARIVIPYHQVIKKQNFPLRLVSSFFLGEENIFLFKGFLPKTRVPVYFLENENYLSRGPIYPVGLSGIKKFLFFSKSVLRVFGETKWQPQIYHLNEWESSLLPVLNSLFFKNSQFKFVLTLHNLSIQGRWNPREIFYFLDIKGNEIDTLKIRDRKGNFNILQQGILNSDIITTVSPTYSKEILSKKYSEGLDKELKEKKVIGILNGIDTEVFNPESDPYLKANYSVKTIREKSKNKIELQKIFRLKEGLEIPLFGFIGRLTRQKGLDLFKDAIPLLNKMPLQIVFLGKGNEKYEKMLKRASKRYSNISARIEFNPALAQKIYGGADALLVPSLFEPCGLVQMIAQRYGTLVIARKTGGLADTIDDGRTGFLFTKAQVSSFLKIIEKSLSVFRNKKKWEKMAKEAMKKDFSWKESAKKYFKIYLKLKNG